MMGFDGGQQQKTTLKRLGPPGDPRWAGQAGHYIEAPQPKSLFLFSRPLQIELTARSSLPASGRKPSCGGGSPGQPSSSSRPARPGVLAEAASPQAPGSFPGPSRPRLPIIRNATARLGGKWRRRRDSSLLAGGAGLATAGARRTPRKGKAGALRLPPLGHFLLRSRTGEVSASQWFAPPPPGRGVRWG